MLNFDWGCRTRLVFGKGMEKTVGERLKEYTDRVLFVYGGGSIKKTGLYDTVVNSMRESGVDYLELSGIRSNPTLEKIYEGIELCRKEKIGFLLGVGGGSVIDVCKAIAMGVPYEGDVWDFFQGEEIKEALPIADILTIPGTGSESSPNTVITNEKTQEKIGIFSDHLRPVFSIMNPELCTTIPKNQIGNGVYDAMSHTMERYFTNSTHHEISDGLDEVIITGAMKNGLKVYQDPTDVDAWAELLMASDLSHCGVSGLGREGDWANHGMEEVISGIYDIPHGGGLSIITLAWMKYVYKKHLPMFVQFAVNVMGVKGSFREPEELAWAGIEAMEEFSRKMGLPTHLSEYGITDEKFEFMAKRCTSRDGTVGRMEKLTWEDVVEIYKLAL